MKRFLIEGGQAGHMKHLYENLSLTFQELLRIMHTAVSGFPEIEVTEKLDGQNLAVSYDPDTGSALGLRTKGHVKLGGISKQEMNNYFTVDREQKHYKRHLKKLQKQKYQELVQSFKDRGDSPAIASKKARAIEREQGIQITASEEEKISALAKSSRLDATPQGAGVVQAFFDAMQNFEEVAERLPREMFVTQDGCRIFYNSEVMDPRSRNVVDYDTETIAIHRVGHTIVCPEESEDGEQTFTSEPFEKAEEYSRQLDKMLSMHQSTGESSETSRISKVGVNNIINFDNFVVDKEFFVETVDKIKQMVSDAGLQMSDSIQNFISVRIFQQIQSEFPNATEETSSRMLKAIIDHATGRPPTTSTVTTTRTGVYQDEALYSTIEKVLRNPKAMSGMLKDAIRPLELAVHDFGVGLLKGFESIYILDNMTAVQGLRGTVGAHLTSLGQPAEKGRQKGSNLSPSDLQAIKVNLGKMAQTDDLSDLADILDNDELLSVLNNISTAVEGLVFDYNGQTYKITGQFAPINQILGIGRYTRSEPVSEQFQNIPDMDVEEEWEECETIAIFPGGFKPPHAGHYLAAKHFLDVADKVYIVIGNAPRSDTSGKVEITDEISKQLWEHYISTDPELNQGDMQVFAPGISPVKWLYDSIDNGTLKCGNTYVAGKGEKDLEDRRFEALAAYAKKKGKQINFKNHMVPPMAGGVSGTEMRDMIAAEDERILNFLPPHLDKMEAEKKKAFLIMIGNDNSTIEPLTMDSMDDLINEIRENLFR